MQLIVLNMGLSWILHIYMEQETNTTRLMLIGVALRWQFVNSPASLASLLMTAMDQSNRMVVQPICRSLPGFLHPRFSPSVVCTVLCNQNAHRHDKLDQCSG